MNRKKVGGWVENLIGQKLGVGIEAEDWDEVRRKVKECDAPPKALEFSRWCGIGQWQGRGGKSSAGGADLTDTRVCNCVPENLHSRHCAIHEKGERAKYFMSQQE